MELTLFATDINESFDLIADSQAKIKSIKNRIKEMKKYDKQLQKGLDLICNVLFEVKAWPEKVSFIRNKLNDILISDMAIPEMVEEAIATPEVVEEAIATPEVVEEEAIATPEVVEEEAITIPEVVTNNDDALTLEMLKTGDRVSYTDEKNNKYYGVAVHIYDEYSIGMQWEENSEINRINNDEMPRYMLLSELKKEPSISTLLEKNEDQEKTEIIEDWPDTEDNEDQDINCKERYEDIDEDQDEAIANPDPNFKELIELEKDKYYELCTELKNAIVLKCASDPFCDENEEIIVWLANHTGKSMKFADIQAKFTEEIKILEYRAKPVILGGMVEGEPLTLEVSAHTRKPRLAILRSTRTKDQLKDICSEIGLQGYSYNNRIEQDPWDNEIRLLKMLDLNVSQLDKLYEFLKKACEHYPVKKIPRSRKPKKITNKQTQEINGQLTLV